MSAMTDGELEELVRRVVRRTLGAGEGSSAASAPTGGIGASPTGSWRAHRPRRRLVTEEEVVALPRGSRLEVPPGTIVTPLASAAALERKIRIMETADAPANPDRTPSSPEPSPGNPISRPTIALGADHGGFATKEDLKAYLKELGYEVRDCGTHSTQAVDYPDFALAVAEMVSSGACGRGIMVDGAGIGSSMVANKVPGVRAALCYDLTTARNAREHNDANVLTLGGRLIGLGLARDIVKVFLETPFAGGRHQPRVDKIKAIEKKYAR